MIYDASSRPDVIEPIASLEEVPLHNEQTIALKIRETHKFLNKLSGILDEFERDLYGAPRKEKRASKDPSCLLEDVMMLPGFAYDCLTRIKAIKEDVV